MSDLEEVPEEQRAPDQDGAIEVAFADGTLPEEDRRAAEAPSAPAPVGDGEPCPTCAALARSSVGTRLEKQLHGWKLQLVDGGTVILSEGATITQALFGTMAETAVAVVAEEITEEVPAPAPFVPEPVLMRGDGTPLHVVDGNMVAKL